MIKDITYYYNEAQQKGIDLDKEAYYSMYNPMTGEYKEWTEVSNHREYLQKCYAIAIQVPIEILRKEFNNITITKDYGALENLRKKVFSLIKEMEKEDLNFKMGFTPITDIRRQLSYLFEDTFPTISFDVPSDNPKRKQLKQQKTKKYLADLFV